LKTPARRARDRCAFPVLERGTHVADEQIREGPMEFSDFAFNFLQRLDGTDAR
jgi:hypothetical protein